MSRNPADCSFPTCTDATMSAAVNKIPSVISTACLSSVTPLVNSSTHSVMQLIVMSFVMSSCQSCQGARPLLEN